MIGREQELHAALYVAIAGRNRLTSKTHTVANAIREVARIGKAPWKIVGVSRETWRRWNLPPGAKNHQRPGAAAQAGLLAVLRRRRLSTAREAKIRSGNITIRATSNYEVGVKRVVGPITLQWAGSDPLVDAYLTHGIEAAAHEFHQAIREEHFNEWMDPANTTSQSYTITGIDLTASPARGSATRSTGGRRRR